MKAKTEIFTISNLVAIILPTLFFYATLRNPDWDDDIWWPVAIYGAFLSLPALLLGLTIAMLTKTSQPVRRGYFATAMLNLIYGMAIFICTANGGGPFVFYCYSLCFFLTGAYLMSVNFAHKESSLKK
ncbi:hypothetical protein BH11BAC5_BH11BAC5_43310 [soil metagenome]